MFAVRHLWSVYECIFSAFVSALRYSMLCICYHIFTSYDVFCCCCYSFRTFAFNPIDLCFSALPLWHSMVPTVFFLSNCLMLANWNFAISFSNHPIPPPFSTTIDRFVFVSFRFVWVDFPSCGQQKKMKGFFLYFVCSLTFVHSLHIYLCVSVFFSSLNLRQQSKLGHFLFFVRHFFQIAGDEKKNVSKKSKDRKLLSFTLRFK